MHEVQPGGIEQCGEPTTAIDVREADLAQLGEEDNGDESDRQPVKDLRVGTRG